MAFQSIKPIENYKFYCELALRRANEAAEKQRAASANKSRFEKSKIIEMSKMSVIKAVLYEKLTNIMKSFPDFDEMTEFYQELVKVTMDYPALIKSLGAVNWARGRIDELLRTYTSKLSRTTLMEYVNVARREFAGRAFSVMKQIRKELEFLEQARKILSEFPSIKSDMKKIAIAGFPNVGKSTLLAKISKSKPEIGPYAFTTKRLNLGYYEKDKIKVQMIDTPGTLNRVEKMNLIEKQAYVAMQYAADVIIYIFDLTEEYPIGDQIKLYEIVKKFKKPVIIYLSKTDLVEKEVVESFKKKHKTAISDIEQLKKELDNAI